MTDPQTAIAMHARAIESLTADGIDVELCLDVMDLVPVLAERVALLEARLADMTAAGIAVGTF